MIFVEQALEAIRDKQNSLGLLIGNNTSIVAAATVQVQGAKAEAQDFNPYLRLQRITEAKEVIPEKVARAYQELQREGCIPSWVDESINHTAMEDAAA